MATEDVIINFRANVKGFLQGLGTTQERFNEMQTTGGKLNKRFKEMKTAGGRLALQMKRLTVGFRGFKAEFLSVLFFGLGIKSFFSGLIKPALEVAGVFELWRQTMIALFLPIALLIFDLLLPFSNFIFNLSDETKLFIGKMVLLAAAFGVFLFLLGSIALGIGGVIVVFSGLFNLIDRLIPDMSVLGVNFSSFIEAGLAIGLVTKLVGFLKNTFRELLDNLLEIPIVKDFIDEFKDGLSIVKDKLGELIGDEEGLGLFETTVDDAKKAGEEFLDSLKSKIDELGIPEFIQSFVNLGTQLEDLIPSLKTIAGFITTIATGINAIKFLFITGPRAAAEEIQFRQKFGVPSTTTSNVNINIGGTLSAAPGTEIDESSLIERIFNAVSVRLAGLSRR